MRVVVEMWSSLDVFAADVEKIFLCKTRCRTSWEHGERELL